MIKAILVASFITSASLSLDPLHGGLESPRLSKEQKGSIARNRTEDATDCVAKAIVSDPKYASADLNHLITEFAVPKCIEPLRSMIDAYDALGGAGSGEKYFMGEYLDSLPNSVRKKIQELAGP